MRVSSRTDCFGESTLYIFDANSLPETSREKFYVKNSSNSNPCRGIKDTQLNGRTIESSSQSCKRHGEDAEIFKIPEAYHHERTSTQVRTNMSLPLTIPRKVSPIISVQKLLQQVVNDDTPYPGSRVSHQTSHNRTDPTAPPPPNKRIRCDDSGILYDYRCEKQVGGRSAHAKLIANTMEYVAIL